MGGEGRGGEGNSRRGTVGGGTVGGGTVEGQHHLRGEEGMGSCSSRKGRRGEKEEEEEAAMRGEARCRRGQAMLLLGWGRRRMRGWGEGSWGEEN